jgi:hypothetical protein
LKKRTNPEVLGLADAFLFETANISGFTGWRAGRSWTDRRVTQDGEEFPELS